MRFSNSGSTASGVTSRPVKPVPPVVMITSIAGSAIQRFTTRPDFLDVVGHDDAVGERVAGRLDAARQRRARLVVGERARVRHREHRDLERHECAGVVETGQPIKARADLKVLQAEIVPPV